MITWWPFRHCREFTVSHITETVLLAVVWQMRSQHESKQSTSAEATFLKPSVSSMWMKLRYRHILHNAWYTVCIYYVQIKCSIALFFFFFASCPEKCIYKKKEHTSIHTHMYLHNTRLVTLPSSLCRWHLSLWYVPTCAPLPLAVLHITCTWIYSSSSLQLVTIYFI